MTTTRMGMNHQIVPLDAWLDSASFPVRQMRYQACGSSHRIRSSHRLRSQQAGEVFQRREFLTAFRTDCQVIAHPVFKRGLQFTIAVGTQPIKDMFIHIDLDLFELWLQDHP